MKKRKRIIMSVALIVAFVKTSTPTKLAIQEGKLNQTTVLFGIRGNDYNKAAYVNVTCDPK